jgi:hypothetical protein
VAFQDLVLPIAGAAVAGAAGFAAWAVYQRFYVAVPPGKALVLFGRKSAPATTPAGPPSSVFVNRAPRILVGGGAIVAPWNRGVGFLTLSPPATDASVRSLHTVDDGRATGWEVSVSVQVKIPTEPEALRHAADHLLGKPDEEVRALVRQAVERNVPAVLARMTPGPAEPDWERLAAEIEASVAPDLVDFGLVVRSVAVTGLQRIAPVAALVRTPEVRESPRTPATRVSASDPDSEFALRLARVERGLSIMGAQVLRMTQEPSPAAIGEVPILERSLADPGSTPEELGDEAYNSTGSERPPRTTRPSRAARSSEEA